MPINEQEWASIATHVEEEIRRVIGQRRDYFITTPVIKRDEIRNVVWVEEFGPTPIPCFSFDYEVTYYDTVAGGGPPFSVNTVQRKLGVVKQLTPLIGDVVLIAREMGADRLPRCLGVLKSTDFLIDEDEED